MSRIYRLPDGSAFFSSIIGGPRDPDVISWLKYDPNNRARRWLFIWRMYRTARELSLEESSQMSHWRSIHYAISCP
jgi:hypothetical protein